MGNIGFIIICCPVWEVKKFWNMVITKTRNDLKQPETIWNYLKQPTTNKKRPETTYNDLQRPEKTYNEQETTWKRPNDPQLVRHNLQRPEPTYNK